MRICLLGETPPASGRPLANTGYANLKAGVLLQARIIEVSDAGHPVFQFEGFRAMAEKPMTGQVGDVWQFEVAPDAGGPSGPQPSSRSSANAAQTPLGSQHPDRLTHNGKSLRLIPLLPGKQTSIAPSRTSPSPLPPTASPTAAMIVAAPSPDNALIQPVQILSTLFQQIRRTALPRTARKGTKADAKPREPHRSFREQASPRSSDRPELTEPKRSDRSGEALNTILASSFQLGRRPVRMKLFRHAPDRRGGEATPSLTAVFLLNCNDHGAVRVDVKMGGDHIYVGIFVEGETLRRQYAEALPSLSNALSSLTKQCYCRVDIAPDLIQAVAKEEEMALEKMGLDIRA